MVAEGERPVVGRSVSSAGHREEPRAGAVMPRWVGLLDAGMLLLSRCQWALCMCRNAPVAVAVVFAASCLRESYLRS